MSSISGISSSASAWSSMSTSRASRQQEMFNKVDSDGNGSVNKSELQSMLDGIAKHTGSTSSTDDTFSKMDSNGDGSLNQSEMEAGMKSLMPAPPSTMAFAQTRNGDGGGGPEGVGGPPPPPPTGDSASTSATSSSSSDSDPLDVNKDGVVSEQERAAGDIKELLKAADTDDDQKISSSEFDKFKDMLTNAANELSSSSASTPESGSNKAFNLSALTDMVLKEYAKAASNSVTQQSVGATVSLAA